MKPRAEQRGEVNRRMHLCRNQTRQSPAPEAAWRGRPGRECGPRFSLEFIDRPGKLLGKSGGGQRPAMGQKWPTMKLAASSSDSPLQR